MIALLEKYNLKEKVICMIPHDEIMKEALPIAREKELTLCFDRELPPIVIIHPSKFSTVKKAQEYNLSVASIGRPVATICGYSIYKKIVAQDIQDAQKHNAAKPPVPIDAIIAWTIDDPDEMKDLIKLGVKGIVTNRPDTLRKVVENWR